MGSTEINSQKLKIRVLISLVVMLVVILILIIIPKETEAEVVTEKHGGLEMGVIDDGGDEAFKKKIQESLNAQVEAGMVSVFVNTNIQMENGNSEAKLLIQNGPNNSFSQRITITDEATTDILYKSPIIEAGYKVETDYLEKELEQGKYDCLASIEILDTDSKETINTVGLPVQITVKN